MTQEQKDLLLKDLCARLPYRVVVSFKNSDTKEAFNQILDYTLVHMAEYIPYIGGIEIKPYLRPMPSMTEKEKKDRDNIVEAVYDGAVIDDEFENVIKYVDWLNAHHFDYRGLIPMSLAIEVTEENNPYKE